MLLEKNKIRIPEFSLIALVGATSSGKTTFAKKHFKPTEVLSSDFFRAMVSDDENDQSVSKEAFDLLYCATEKRLRLMKTTVIDATNVQQSARKRIIELAKEHDVHPVAIVLNVPEKELFARNAARPDRGYPERVVAKQSYDLKRSIKNLSKEGFRFIFVLDSEQEINGVEIIRTKLWNDKKDEHGPFDIIGDVHGCFDELCELLTKLGYTFDKETGFSHPGGRKAIFCGDLCDRGPKNVEVLSLVMKAVKSGNAFAVPGNHDMKLYKYLCGRAVQQTHGLERTVAEIEGESEEFKKEVKEFLRTLVSHYVFDDGKLAVSHAGLKEEYVGRGSPRVRDFCIFGETTGETDEYGLPVRVDWASCYRGKATVVYGHIPRTDVLSMNGTYCIDTGCVFGGKLTAYRYPEREIADVPAKAVYYEPAKPLSGSVSSVDDMLTAGDVQGDRYLTTGLMPSVTVRSGNASAALEVMSRYAADPHWLIYLPPTMSPCETSPLDGYLEHPLEAFSYYRTRGVRRVVCEKKHMGSRAVIVLCRTPEAAASRFGVSDGSRGIIYTRTGRHFFDDAQIENEVLSRLESVLTKTGFWEDFATDWVCLDTELMPWSEKARLLLEKQYAPVGRAGKQGLNAAVSALRKACKRPNTPFEVGENTSGQNADPKALLKRFAEKKKAIDGYIDAYREYCWKVNSPDDLKIAPFHLLACEGNVFTNETHVWHMEKLEQYCTGVDPIFIKTDHICVDTVDEESVKQGVSWWLSLTGSGGEGMVVKPESFVARRQTELLQPAVKCRGAEYLRIIYGPEYLMPEHLTRLKKRSLGRKRSLALREFALGAEALTRFVAKEPLYRVHECVFGVLAFESEPVDPRL
ncbi:MAG: polynucleotide kinase-phosphatase [Clostridia bacterium]|nr:polynucleotide kinase-phosphatase [Clostridia bacterium]